MLNIVKIRVCKLYVYCAKLFSKIRRDAKFSISVAKIQEEREREREREREKLTNLT